MDGRTPCQGFLQVYYRMGQSARLDFGALKVRRGRMVRGRGIFWRANALITGSRGFDKLCEVGYYTFCSEPYHGSAQLRV